MILAVYLECSDTCGNTDEYGPLGYIQVASIEEGLQDFPNNTPFVKYRLEEVLVNFPFLLKMDIEQAIAEGKFR